MKLLDRLEEIDQAAADAYVIHEKFERKFDIHSHERDQLSYVEDGIAYVSMANEYLVVPAKHFLWIPAGIAHQLKVSHSATQLHSIYFKKNNKPFTQRIGIYPASRLIIELIKFTERWNKQFVDYDAPNGHALYTLHELLHLAKDQQVKLQLSTSDNERIDAIVQYIQQQYNTPLHIEDLAKRFNMSERSFCRFFKKELNTTFLQYLKTYKVIQAMNFLQTTDWSIERIANEIGYESVAAFSNTFLEYTGMRPTEMKKIIN